jgi:ribosomal peptide maturation radical SAM protein 1
MMPKFRQDICLVCMPDCPVTLPAIGLGLLSAILKDAKFAVKTHYANLWFADVIGLERLRILRRTRVEDLAADWLFSGPAFRCDAPPPPDGYLERLVERNSSLRRRGKDETFLILREMREKAERFIDVAAERILEHQPRIVGCTSTFQQHVASLAVMRRIREFAPDVVTLMGGANCETVMGRATHRAFAWVDYIVSGEADELIVPLCRMIVSEGRDVPIARLPTGVFAPLHRSTGYPEVADGDGVPRASVTSLANVPIPDYDDYFEQLDAASLRGSVQPAIPFESSRGCWWGERSHCTFCGLNGLSMNFRSKNAEIVLNEVETLHQRYRATSFHAVDTIIDMRYFDSLLPALADRKLPLGIFYETKANLKRRHVELMRDAGILWVQPGIESLNTNVLKAIGKGLTAVQNVLLLKLARQAGLRLTWTNLLGLPNEQDEWYAESAAWLPLISHFQPGGLNWLRYDRYSPYYTRAKQYGYELAPAELYSEIYPLPAEELSDIAYFFERRGRTVRPKLDGGDGARNLADQEVPDDGPGKTAYRQAILDWQVAWAKEIPVLQCMNIDGVLCIEDTRAVAPARETTVEGLASEVVLLLTDEALTRAQLCARLQKAKLAAAPAVVNDAVDALIQRKLALELDDKIVSLVLFAPLPPIPPVWLSRGGSTWN